MQTKVMVILFPLLLDTSAYTQVSANATEFTTDLDVNWDISIGCYADRVVIVDNAKNLSFSNSSSLIQVSLFSHQNNI